MVRNLVSSLSAAVSVAALSVAVLSVLSELGDEHAVRPKVALNIADKSNGDFRELSIEFILEIIELIHLTTSIVMRYRPVII